MTGNETVLDAGSVTVSVENLGGIDRCDVTLTPGITVLTGRNATNRTSLLKSVAAALGGSAATLKSDAEEGRVELSIGDETYTRRLARENGTVTTSGRPYTDESDVVDLFGCLLGDNPVRQAVERGDDLREVTMRPIDQEEIRREIRDLRSERASVESRLEEIARERDRLPELRERERELQDELESVDEEVASVEAALEEYDADEAEAERAEGFVEQLETLEGERRQVETELETQEASLRELSEEEERAETELDELAVRESEIDELEDRLSGLEDRRRALDQRVSDLSAIVEFNEEVVSGTRGSPGTGVEGDVTAALDPSSQQVECWTCGSTVERAEIAGRLEELRTVVRETREERGDVAEEIAELRARRDELQEAATRETELERTLEDVARERSRREDRIEELETERERLQSEIAALQERVEETAQLRESEIVEKHQRISQLEYERGQLERELAEVRDELGSLDDMADEQRQLEERLDDLREAVARQQSRIEDLEREAVGQFNEHMAEVLDLLEYENVARVWIERKPGASPEETAFELNVVRESSGGTVYEDDVGHLSESEREVVGLVVALAGYLVHEVHDLVPAMLLDSLEAIDADRVAAIVEYFAEFAPYLVVALLPEDAQALSDEHERVPATALHA